MKSSRSRCHHRGSGLSSLLAVSSRVVVSINGRSVFVGTSDGVVLALNPSNGVTLWSAAAAREDPVLFSLALSADGSRLFVGYRNSTLRALCASTGSFLWRRWTRGPKFEASSPSERLHLRPGRRVGQVTKLPSWLTTTGKTDSDWNDHSCFMWSGEQEDFENALRYQSTRRN